MDRHGMVLVGKYHAACLSVNQLVLAANYQRGREVNISCIIDRDDISVCDSYSIHW